MSKILIIEDDPYVQRFYERLFHTQEYEVLLASNGEDGIRIAKEQRPGLILLDIIMPVMNGIDVLKILTNDEETKGCSVVMLTNIDDHETMRQAYTLGAQGFIIKAKIEPEKLIDEVERYLAPGKH